MKLAYATLVLLFACGGKAKPAPGSGSSSNASLAPGGIVGPGIGADLGKCGALDKDALCKCLSPDAEIATCDFVDDGSVPAAHVLRVGNEEQDDTFLVADDGSGKLRALSELLYEQHHGKRDSDLSDPKLTLQTISGTRILRLEYTMSASTDYANESYDEDLSGTAVKVCVLDGNVGCPIETFSTCKVERSDYADPPNPSNNAKGDTTATIAIGADGTATVTPGVSNGSPADCAIEAKSVKLVP